MVLYLDELSLSWFDAGKPAWLKINVKIWGLVKVKMSRNIGGELRFVKKKFGKVKLNKRRSMGCKQ